jgi:hypothetical protein
MPARSYSITVADDSSDGYRIIRVVMPARARVNATGIGSRSSLNSQRSSFPRRQS